MHLKAMEVPVVRLAPLSGKARLDDLLRMVCWRSGHAAAHTAGVHPDVDPSAWHVTTHAPFERVGTDLAKLHV